MKRFNFLWCILVIIFGLAFLFLTESVFAATNTTTGTVRKRYARPLTKLRSLKAAVRPAVVWSESVTTNSNNQITKIMTGTHTNGTVTTVCLVYNGMPVPFEYRQKILTAPEEERMNFVSAGPNYRTDMPSSGEVPKVDVQRVTDVTITEETRLIELRW